MKQLYYIFIILLILGCSTKKNIIKDKEHTRGIVYVLPDEVKARLALLHLEDDTAHIYFSLETISYLSFRIYLDKFDTKDNWVENTNRFISISDKLYPLTFDLDMYFANKETSEEFLKNQKEGIYLRSQRTIIRDHVYHIDFTFKGKILYEGY